MSDPTVTPLQASLSHHHHHHHGGDLYYFRYLSFDATFGQVFHVFRQRYLTFLTITFMNYMLGWVVALIAAYLLGADLQIDGFSASVTVNIQSTNSYYHHNSSSSSSGYGEDDQGNYYYNGAYYYRADGGDNDDQSQQWQMTFGNDYFYDENGNLVQVQETPAMQAWQMLLYYVECGIYYCFLCIAHGASVWLAAHLYLDQHPTLENAFRQAAKYLWSLVASLFLSGLMIALPLFLMILIMIPFAFSGGGGDQSGLITIGIIFTPLLICWIIFLQVIFYHVYPVIMVERLGPIQALKRSYHLSEDHRCYIFSVLFCWAMVRCVIGIVIASIAMTGDLYSWQWWLSKALDTGCAILFAAIESVFQAVLYLRNRIVKEKLDRVTLAGDLGSDILSSDMDQSYIVMGSCCNEEDQEGDKEKKNVVQGVMA